MPGEPVSRLLWRLSSKQHGVVTRRQLLDHGMSAEAVRHRLANGRLHRVARGVYAVGRPELSREGRWLAAVLCSGDVAGLSHADGAALYGIRDRRRGPVHVSIPRTSPARRRPRVRVHRVGIDADDLREVRGVPVVSPARILLNQAATTGARRLEADVNAADALGLITPERLRRAVAGFRGLDGVAALRALLDRHTFTLTDSELERMFLPLARSAGLSRPRTRARVNGFRVDFHWPDLGLVVETDGLRYHRTAAQQTRDLIRDQTHRAAGLQTLRFSHWQVAHEQAWVRRTLRTVAARLSGS